MAVPQAGRTRKRKKPADEVGGCSAGKGMRAIGPRRYIFFDFFFVAFFFVGFIGSAVIGALPGPPRDTAGPPELWPVDDCWANAGAAASSIAAEAINRTFFIMNSWMRAVQRPALASSRDCARMLRRHERLRHSRGSLAVVRR